MEERILEEVAPLFQFHFRSSLKEVAKAARKEF